mgnify:CR=1 FL=1
MFCKKTTIIIRTKNSSNIIDQTLKALFSQSFQYFDLFIVDSGSTDDTLKKCSHFKHTYIHIDPKEYHPGKVLNKIVSQCHSEVIVFLNSDCVMLLPKTLQLLLDELEDYEVQASFARQITRPEAVSWVKRDYETSFPNHLQPKWMHFSLPLAAIKKDAWGGRQVFLYI